MPETLMLENRVALVTGGGRGIGRAIAHELARRGAAVVINDKSGESVVCSEINDAGGKASCFKADISDFTQAQELVKFTMDTFGDLHILVNNAGITRDGLILTMSEEDWDTVLTDQSQGHIQLLEGSGQAHDPEALRPHRQHRFRRRTNGQRRANELRLLEGRTDRIHQSRWHAK